MDRARGRNNHLDLWARDALEVALKQFNGTLLFVSHDRYFLNQVAVEFVTKPIIVNGKHTLSILKQRIIFIRRLQIHWN